jgi:hypothetical protein
MGTLGLLVAPDDVCLGDRPQSVDERAEAIPLLLGIRSRAD